MYRKNLPLSASLTRRAFCEAEKLPAAADLQPYLGFLEAVGEGIGELTPVAGEDDSHVASRLASAAAFLGLDARVWRDCGRVYFFVRRDSLVGW